MSPSHTRVTIDISSAHYKKITLLAAYHGKSMGEILVELITRGLEEYRECFQDHTPNATTKEALEKMHAKKGLQKADTVEELFKKLN